MTEANFAPFMIIAIGRASAMKFSYFYGCDIMQSRYNKFLSIDNDRPPLSPSPRH